jgi:hypothetical protein
MRTVVAITVASFLTLSGCGSDVPELKVEAFGVVLDGVPDTPAPYFTTPLCSEDGSQVVTIVSVEAVDGDGGAAEFAFAVDWPGGEDADPRFGANEDLPAAFEPAIGSSGTVPACGEDETADIAVIFPATGEDSVRVERIEVGFEIDGEVGTASGDVLFVQCGRFLTASTDGESCRDERGG